MTSMKKKIVKELSKMASRRIQQKARINRAGMQQLGDSVSCDITGNARSHRPDRIPASTRRSPTPFPRQERELMTPPNKYEYSRPE